MVSIVLPYDKDRGYLQRMIISIKAQTYADIELIEVHNPFPVAKNFNIGLEKAKGEFIKVVGEDDWLPNTSIRDSVEGMEDHPWICANAFNMVNGTGLLERPDPETLNLRDMIKRNVIHGGSTLYRTEILREIGGMDETLWTGEEYDMNMHLMSKGYLPGYINKAVYFYQVSSFQKSTIYRRENLVKREAALNEIRQRYGDSNSSV